MTKRNGRPVAPVDDSQDINTDDDFSEIPLDDELDEFIDVARASNREISAYLYRVDTAGYSAKKKSLLLNIYSGDIPDQICIARQYGGGTYKLIAVIPATKTAKREIKAAIFHIDPSFNAIGQPGPAPAASTAANMAGQLQPLMALMGEFVKMFAPMMKPADPLVSAATISNIIAESAKQNMRIVGELQKRIINQDAGDTGPAEDPGGGDNWLKTIMPYVEKFLPMLLDKKNGAAVDIIKSSPQYAEIMQDQAKIDAVEDLLIKELGEQKAGAVMDTLFPVTQP